MNIHVSARTERREPSSIDPAFARDAISGLSQYPKKISPKYFYDEIGSHLFERITLLPEYYPTRTELRILREHGTDIADSIPENAALVEFGAGATTKVRLLLETCEFGAYVPVDISGDFLTEQARIFRSDHPQLKVYPVAADFTTAFPLPHEIQNMPKVGFFPGSTIGNFDPTDAEAFLRSARAILGRGAAMIIGVDLEKDEDTLHAAYNEATGVTAKFNLNVLERMNRELGANFDPATFDHHALYNHHLHRIEMHLISRKAHAVRMLGRTFSFGADESIHTESSYKYSVTRFQKLARRAGWMPDRVWTDARDMFSVHALRAG
ncbi:MAG: L-histidine N(alpha)-methyltransferase [Afipia sp.]|nr:L-histidine N(alpha)-methyltransferase [Afipia sp.]